MLFKFFSHLQNFLKISIDTHPIDLSCHQKFEKNSPTGSENISARSWKIWKSHGRLDPTLRMREVLHARSIKFLRVRNDRLFFVTRRYFFPYDRFTGYKKSNQNRFGRALPFAFALTCFKIYLLYPSLSDFDSFRWRVHFSDGVCRLRARVQDSKVYCATVHKEYKTLTWPRTAKCIVLPYTRNTRLWSVSAFWCGASLSITQWFLL